MRRYHIACMCAAVCLTSGCGTTSQESRRSQLLTTNSANVASYSALVNLRASDVPSFVPARYPKTRETTSGPFGTAVERCAGVGRNPRDIVGVTSQSFDNVRREQSDGGGFPIYSVQSGVYMMSSSASADHDVMAVVSTRGLRCLKAYVVNTNPPLVSNSAKVRALFGSSSSTNHGSPTTTTSESAESSVPVLSKIDVSLIHTKVQGESVSGLRTVAHTATAEGGARGTPNYYENTFVFAMGHAVIMLTSVGSPNPVSAGEERRLLSLLYARAKMHRR